MRGIVLASIVLLVSCCFVFFQAKNVLAPGLPTPLPPPPPDAITIESDGSVDPHTAAISTTDNHTYTFTGGIYNSIVVQRDDIVVEGNGHTVLGPGSGMGVFMAERNNVTIRNIKTRWFEASMWVLNSRNCCISRNNLDGELRIWGGYVSNVSSSYNCVSENNMTNASISLRSSSDSTIRGNNITMGAIHLTKSSYNKISGNNILGGTILIESDSVGNTVSENKIIGSAAAIIIDGSRHTIVGNNITGCYVGMKLNDPGSSSICENNVADNTYGFWLWVGGGNNISGNNFTANGIALLLDACSDNNITGNHILDSGWTQARSGDFNGGIFFDHSSQNTLRNNCLANNTYNIAVGGDSLQDFVNDVDASNEVDGRPVCYWTNKQEMTVPPGAGYVALVNCTGITVQNLTLRNSWDGLLLAFTTNSTITQNNITDNHCGIHLFRGLFNLIYNNNLINNENQVKTEFSLTAWDNGYPSGGNFWSDCKCQDAFGGPSQNETGGDGMSDTPYLIDSDNLDKFPLAGGFSVFNVAQEYHLQTICNSSITDFQFNGTAISFNVSGENDTPGFCRICIPTGLMNGTYKVLVNSTEVQCNLLPCSNEMYSYLYFNYTQSTQQVTIITEFPSLLIIPLFMIATLLAVIVYGKKRAKVSWSPRSRAHACS
jgi:parallel beta-helix repeat protein